MLHRRHRAFDIADSQDDVVDHFFLPSNRAGFDSSFTSRGRKQGGALLYFISGLLPIELSDGKATQ